MAIEFSCETCGRNMKVKDEMAGRTGKCPDCGGRIKIPDGVMDAYAVDDDYDDYGDVGSRGRPVADPKRKPCPACGEMIMKTAAVCRFCDETFDGRARSRSKRGGGGHADVDQDMSTGDWVVAILCSGIGCIAGIIWMIQGKPKGTKMFGISLVMVIIWNVIRFAIAGAAGP